jgi:isoquinoline 1-oxidoreductase alpha subunit
MAASVLLQHNRTPSEDDIRREITNLCRCGIYPRLVEAIMLAALDACGDETVDAPPAPGILPAEAARSVPALVVRR